MRKFVAYFLIAITLLSNGMVDFAIKVCHDAELSSNKQIVSNQISTIEFSNSAQFERISNANSLKNSSHKAENRLHSEKSTQKSCCSSKSFVKHTESTRLNQLGSTSQNTSPNNIWKQLSDILFITDEHPCCADNSKAQIKCCTLLNLYYFTPKFLEETKELIPNIIWQNLLSSGEIIRINSLVQLKNNHFKLMDRSDPPVLHAEDISSRFCVWII